MPKTIIEKNGNRTFERLSRWNTLDYTLVSRKHRFAEYTDNPNSKAEKLDITCFMFGNAVHPFARAGILDKPITLSDSSIITRYDPETKFFLEINEDISKVRVYKEVIGE